MRDLVNSLIFILCQLLFLALVLSPFKREAGPWCDTLTPTAAGQE